MPITLMSSVVQSNL